MPLFIATPAERSSLYAVNRSMAAAPLVLDFLDNQ
jgi:hypothetical protein